MRGGYEKDLFGNPVPPPERKSRATKPRQAGLSGNVQSSPTIPGDTPSPPGEYHVRTIIGSEVNRTLAADRIHSTADLAQATQYLYRSAVERLDGIVTDKDGRPLAVVGGFKGSIDSASVYPSTLVAEAVRVPDAANIWFSHNHPSGLSSLSNADKRLSGVLSDVFEGSGIEPRGLIAVGQGQFSDVDGYTGPIPASGATVTVPAIEREQEGEPTNITIESPGAARLAGAAYYKQEENPGILLLNTRNQVIGWAPISQPMIEGPLRHTGQLRAIYRAISESNSAAAILIHGGELDHVLVHADDAGGNIAAALDKAGVRPLDVLNAKTGESRAEKGRPIANSIMYRDGVAEEGATYGGAGLSKADAQDLTLRFVRDYPGALELAYRFRQNTTELYGSRADEVPASMKGGYVPKETPHNGRNYRGRIDIPLENMRDTRDLLLTLRHEVVGHYGANTFAPEEKRALLDGLVAARNEPGIKPLWEGVDRHYGDRSLDVRAEEVFALHCEGIAPRHHINDPQVADRGQRALLETCIERTRVMQAADLSSIACMVAQGLHDRTRTQQTFPEINELLRKDNTMEPKKPFHEVVAEKLIEQLKAGTAPWQKPWSPGEPNAYLPMNPTTGKRYKGVNAIHLMAQGRSDARWMTYKQAAAEGAQVRKGEKGTPVQYWKFSEEQTKLDEQGKPVLDGEGKPVKENVMLERPRVFFATVFNAEQIDGLPPIQQKTEQQWNAVERAEHILNASGAKITHAAGDRAFYRPSTDSITMPERGQFESADRYYATALHELGHWTGHPSRLDRDLSHPFGSEGYAKEELRAEIASMILGDELGIGHDPGQHVAYVGSWIKALQDDPLEVFRASADAEKIHDYVLAFEQKQVQEQTQQQTQQPEAFIDSIGMLRRWDTADPMPGDWQGIAKSTTDTFFYVGREGEERTFTALKAENFEQAQQEAAIVEALAVDIREVLNNPDVTFNHFEAYQGDTLEQALRDRGLTTVGSVTGHDPGSFSETAWTRLSPVFGITPDHEDMGNPYLERKGLAQEFMLKAEQLHQALQQGQEASMQLPEQQAAEQLPAVAEAWTLGHLERGTLARALDGANQEQIEKVSAVLNAMQPLNTQNDFWTRHELPQDVDALESKLRQAGDFLERRGLDAAVAEARTAGDYESMDKAATEALGFTLPHDWNGNVQVQGNVTVMIDGKEHVEPAAALGVEPTFWGVYAQLEDGRHDWLADFNTQEQAEELAERLGLIDANSEKNEHEKAAKLARVQEERVRRDPSSTDEDISAAKEARKAAEATAMLAESETQRRNAERERDERDRQQAAQQQKSERTYINVPYREKNEAKELGARWDRQQQSWYVPGNLDAGPFAKWVQGAATAATEGRQEEQKGQQQGEAQTTQQRTYLAVPYGERGAAKAAGAMWDKAAKSWYAGPKADMERLQRWMPDNVRSEQGPAMSPREEFAEALRSIGCVVSGEHPIMDGKKHRIGVEGDKKGEKAGFYVGHLDGHPAGYIKNNRTGIDMKWKSKGYALDPAEKAKLQAEAAAKLAERAAEQERVQEATAQRVTRQTSGLQAIEQPTPYLNAKGIQVHDGVLTDKEGQKTYIPAFDAGGKQWTMQYIQEDGTKRFAKDSRKEGCFHPVGGMDAVASAPALIVAEGYATAAQVAEAAGQATIAAFDSGNLEAVAKALHEKFPDKPVIIAGDDDRHLELTQGVNPGRSKAEAAAKAVGGKALFPIFAPGENTYPADLPPITPQAFREHERAQQRLDAAEAGKVQLTEKEAADLKRALLSSEQLGGLAGMKAHTDFNDLATRSSLGREAVNRQVSAAVAQAVQAAERKAEQKQERVEKQEQKQEQKQRRGARVG